MILKQEGQEDDKYNETIKALMITDESSRINSIEMELLKVCKGITGHEQLQASDDIASLGIDSLTTSEVEFGIRQSFGVNLEAMAVLGSTDVTQLAYKVEAKMKEIVVKYG